MTQISELLNKHNEYYSRCESLMDKSEGSLRRLLPSLASKIFKGTDFEKAKKVFDTKDMEVLSEKFDKTIKEIGMKKFLDYYDDLLIKGLLKVKNKSNLANQGVSTLLVAYEAGEFSNLADLDNFILETDPILSRIYSGDPRRLSEIGLTKNDPIVARFKAAHDKAEKAEKSGKVDIKELQKFCADQCRAYLANPLSNPAWIDNAIKQIKNKTLSENDLYLILANTISIRSVPKSKWSKADKVAGSIYAFLLFSYSIYSIFEIVPDYKKYKKDKQNLDRMRDDRAYRNSVDSGRMVDADFTVESKTLESLEELLKKYESEI